MRLNLRYARRATATALATSVAVVSLLTSACTPQTSGTKVISGTIKGADGRIVDVMVGFDVLDAAGRKLDLGYIKAGYSSIQRLNHCVSAQGATTSQRCPGTGVVTGYNWSLRVPSYATTVYIEVYPKAPTTNNWVTYRGYTGPMPGVDNMSRYAKSYRRAISVPFSRGGVSIVLPKVYSAGGSTGSLVGHINGWPQGVTGRINAWSLAGDQPSLGFGMGTVYSNGNYRIDNLQSGQRYGVIADGSWYHRQITDYQRATSSDTLISYPGQQKAFNF